LIAHSARPEPWVTNFGHHAIHNGCLAASVFERVVDFRFTPSIALEKGTFQDNKCSRRIHGGLTMDENRVEGSLRNAGGKVQEGVGRTTGDTKSTVEGVMNQAAGTTQNLYGQSADVARETASNLDTWLRNTIENQPYTSAIVALGIGWLLGRMHRPL
jgi:uncharacterized protein YjbJ (UPF0337 family)